MFNCPGPDLALTRLFPFVGFQIITEPGSLEDLPCLERDKRSIRHNHADRFRGDSNCYFDKYAVPVKRQGEIEAGRGRAAGVDRTSSAGAARQRPYHSCEVSRAIFENRPECFRPDDHLRPTSRDYGMAGRIDRIVLPARFSWLILSGFLRVPAFLGG